MDVGNAEPDDGLIAELRELNRSLDRRRRASGTVFDRRRLALQHGFVNALHRLGGQEIHSLFNGSGMVGVDGSLNTRGASFPYTVTLFRALARSTRPGKTGERFWAYRVFSPLLAQHRAAMQAQLDQGLEPEEILARIRWGTLATLEAEVGQDALEREKPRLLLWDGGFARLEAHAPAIWEQLQASALRQGTIMLGVTEEIATRALAGSLLDTEEKAAESCTPGAFREREADREFLYGVLQPGEAFRTVAPAGRTSRWGRVYTRLARHPQVIAVDYLTGQAGELEAALNWLYTITPSHGRGFPLWLDVVDHEVRLTGEQMEALLAACLDPALQELFLKPLRARRM